MDASIDPLEMELRLGPIDASDPGRTAPPRRHPFALGWVVSRYEEVAAVLTDRNFASDRRRSSLPGLAPQGSPLPAGLADLEDVFGRMLMFCDPPAHLRLRAVTAGALGRKGVERARPTIQDGARAIVAGLERGQDIDFMASVANRLPAMVLAHLFGVPAHQRSRFESWSDALAQVIDSRHTQGWATPVRSALEDLRTWLEVAIEDRRRSPTDDVVGVLVREGFEKGLMSRDELISTCALLLAVGRETTSYLIGGAAWALLRHPEERARLVDRPVLLSNLVEEALRHGSPAQLTSRVSTQAASIGGYAVGPGEVVVLLLGTANRDPARFPDPGRFDMSRQPNPHLAFGAGPHGCLGANLARLQARAVLEEFLQRFPDFEGDPKAARWKPTIVHRGLSYLPIAL